MKKLVAVLLSILMVSVFTACESSDYKKAMSLYESGAYEEAADLFASLGAYEDSADMVDKCKYGHAVACYDAGNYTEALSYFTELGNYKGAEQYRKNAAWYALYEYVKANGTKTGEFSMLQKASSNGTTKVFISASDDSENLFLTVQDAKDAGLGNKYSNMCSIGLIRGSQTARYTLHSDMQVTILNMTGSTAEEASGSVDLTTLTSGTKLDYKSNYSCTIKDVNGGVKTSKTPSSTALLSASQELLGTALNYGKSILSETGLGVTMQDIGFVAVS